MSDHPPDIRQAAPMEQVVQLMAQPLQDFELRAIGVMRQAGRTTESIATIVLLSRQLGFSIEVFALSHPLVLQLTEAPDAANSRRKSDSKDSGGRGSSR